MAIIMLCEKHLGTPETDYNADAALQVATFCPQCRVIDAGSDD